MLNNTPTTNLETYDHQAHVSSGPSTTLTVRSPEVLILLVTISSMRASYAAWVTYTAGITISLPSATGRKPCQQKQHMQVTRAYKLETLRQGRLFRWGLDVHHLRWLLERRVAVLDEPNFREDF